MRYLAFVRVENLHPSDYCGGTEKIKTVINFAISSMQGVEANEKNIAFSFPKNPAIVPVDKEPVIVEIKFWSPAIFSPPQNDMADQIRERLRLFFGAERGDVLVLIDSGGNVARSPR